MPFIDSSKLEGREIQPNLIMRRLISGDPEEQKTALASAKLRIGELELRPGGSIGPHGHTDHDEAMIVIQGEVEITLGDQVQKLSPGQAALAPANLAHIIANRGSTMAKCLIISHR